MHPSQEFIKPSGLVHLTLYDAFGSVKKDIVVPNLVVQSGLNHIAKRMANVYAADTNDAVAKEMSHMALGASSDTGTAIILPLSLSNTQLGSQLGNRVAVTPDPANQAKAVVSVPANGPATATYTALFAAGNATGAVVEAGIFNALTGGTMLCRTIFPVINKLETDSLAITWTITIS